LKDDRYSSLKLDSQLCFPLYACSKEILRQYRPFLDELDLTYTQYAVMMALWEAPALSVSELGRTLFLDSGTLTPLLKKLESKGYVRRTRSSDDERVVMISITQPGLDMREKALSIPQGMRKCIKIDDSDFAALYRILHKMIDGFEQL